MKFSESYCKACITRKVPLSVLVANGRALEGKSEEEQYEMREAWAKEILEKYPPKKPGERRAY